MGQATELVNDDLDRALRYAEGSMGDLDARCETGHEGCATEAGGACRTEAVEIAVSMAAGIVLEISERTGLPIHVVLGRVGQVSGAEEGEGE